MERALAFYTGKLGFTESGTDSFVRDDASPSAAGNRK
jgi:catechol 2,3-dioxygenase-like lactoylglutathione lyase family enzyme